MTRNLPSTATGVVAQLKTRLHLTPKNQKTGIVHVSWRVDGARRARGSGTAHLLRIFEFRHYAYEVAHLP